MSLAEQLKDIVKKAFKTFINSDGLVDLLTSISMIVFWIILAYIITKVVKLLIFKTRSLNKHKESKEQETVRRLINNVVRFFFIFWIVIMVLKELGLDLVPILAGAGVLAFAVGFGAQELIKDVISGMFLILEKTFKIGDYVEIGNHSGTVIDVGIRRIKLQNWRGEVITINNGDIKSIKNASLNPSFAVVEFTANYDFDLQIFNTEDFKTFLTNFKNNHENVLEMPENILVVDLINGLKFNATIKTKTRKHIAIERSFRKELINFFKDKKIDVKIPIKIEKKEE